MFTRDTLTMARLKATNQKTTKQQQQQQQLNGWLHLANQATGWLAGWATRRLTGLNGWMPERHTDGQAMLGHWPFNRHKMLFKELKLPRVLMKLFFHHLTLGRWFRWWLRLRMFLFLLATSRHRPAFVFSLELFCHNNSNDKCEDGWPSVWKQE